MKHYSHPSWSTTQATGPPRDTLSGQQCSQQSYTENGKFKWLSSISPIQSPSPNNLRGIQIYNIQIYNIQSFVQGGRVYQSMQRTLSLRPNFPSQYASSSLCCYPIILRSNTHILLEFWGSSTTLCVIPPLKYLDCLHKVCGGDQLRILLSVFNTQNVCTSVVMIQVKEQECVYKYCYEQLWTRGHKHERQGAIYVLYNDILNYKSIFSQSIKLSNAFDINVFQCAVLTAPVLALWCTQDIVSVIAHSLRQ